MPSAQQPENLSHAVVVTTTYRVRMLSVKPSIRNSCNLTTDSAQAGLLLPCLPGSKGNVKIDGQIQSKTSTFQTFSEFLVKPAQKVIILRHDVDAKKENSLRFAKIQHQVGIRGTYYFRIVPKSFDENIIKQIADMGHEVGYHYEDIDLASSKFVDQGSSLEEEELFALAIELFTKNLNTFRKLVPVKTR